MTRLQNEYIVSAIYEYTRRPKFNRIQHVYNFECPICNEGSSRGKKRRGFFVPNKYYIHCHNCGYHSNPLKWIKDVSNKSYNEIIAENNEFFSSADSIVYNTEPDIREHVVSNTLPRDSINLFNDKEVQYYKRNERVQRALHYIKRRRIDTAINRPKAVYTSIKDTFYGDCICFPFYGLNNDIDFFQVRSLSGEEPRYRGKYGADKTVFNIDRVDQSMLNIFIFEGPIDSMFVKNGVAIAGTSISDKQSRQLNMFPLHRKIWCLDNQRLDATSKELSMELLDRGENVFIWPAKYSRFKDLNEMCCEYSLDQISSQFILTNTFSSKMQLVASNAMI